MKEQFKQLLARNGWIKWIPNSLTLCNSLCGFTAILLTIQIYKYSPQDKIAMWLAWSAWMILFAMIFDALDGFAARILNAASMHGLQMDSLSDMVTFGVAPATLVFVISQNNAIFKGQTYVIWLFACIYMGCAALRLATYNVHAILEKKSGDKFSGLPSPGAAAAICSIVLYIAQKKAFSSDLILLLPFYAMVLGGLMVSKVPYLHFGKWILTVKRNKRRMIALLLMVLSVAIFPAEAFLLIINGYVISGLVIHLISCTEILKRPEETHVTEQIPKGAER